MTDDSGRDPKTGRFKKGFSGFKGRTAKKPQTLLPHEWAEAVLEAAAHPLEVTDRRGKIVKLPAYAVSLRQLASLSTQRDKHAIRQFNAAITEAAKTLQAHKKRQFERLGLYLQSLDEGKPWPLDQAEAAFYQDLANQAGVHIKIEAYDPSKRPAEVGAEDVAAVLADPNVASALRSGGAINADAQQAIIRRALRAYEAHRFSTKQR
ncbi:MAG: hypothetical protein NW206_16010 [Hyphomonadaceae bacterium]|nr:hypothetical protein [Hyphomonadaceae bacterium]